MNITITLTDKQQTAFNKRVTGTATAETLAATIVTEQAQAWSDSDYQAASAELVSKLKDQPQAVLDGLISQLNQLP
jgi:hypothetical protein